MKKKDMDGIPMRNADIKKLTAAQKKIAGAAPPFNKITGADFKALKKKKKK